VLVVRALVAVLVRGLDDDDDDASGGSAGEFIRMAGVASKFVKVAGKQKIWMRSRRNEEGIGNLHKILLLWIDFVPPTTMTR
jgi:hypothetical protein